MKRVNVCLSLAAFFVAIGFTALANGPEAMQQLDEWQKSDRRIVQASLGVPIETPAAPALLAPEELPSVTAPKPEMPPKLPEAVKPAIPLEGQNLSSPLNASREPDVRSRFTFRADFGDGVGYTRGYTYIEGFVPIYQCPGEYVVFIDARGVNFDARDRWEWNAGGGLRTILPRSDWVFGVNSFFDWRDTGPSIFRQVGLGFEGLGPVLDTRANIYFPVGSTRNAIGIGNPAFVGTTIALDRTFENAMFGYDLEIGAPIPGLDCWGARAFLGYYHYDNNGAPSIDGIRGRFEAQLNNNVTAHFAIQNDQVFNTTVTGGLALHWGGRRSGGACRSVVERLNQRVVRDPNIVVTRSIEREAAIDPNTGRPIEVRHVNSNAAAGGDGTFERPYQTLAQLQAGSPTNSILFAHLDSVFNNQGIVLKNAQRFLGDGTLHTFASTQGTFFVPVSNAGNKPQIIMSPSQGVVLANDNEVSGFHFANPGLRSIGGINIVNFNINNNSFLNPSGNQGSIFITNGSGVGHITNNTFTQTNANTLTTGFTISDSNGPLRLAVLDNTTSGHRFAGGFIRSTSGGSQIVATVRNNQFGETIATHRGFYGLATSGSLGLQLLNNTSTQGYKLEQSGGGVFRVENTLATNVGPFTQIGTINVVPVGTFGFQDP